jgi:hypothetical protein
MRALLPAMRYLEKTYGPTNDVEIEMRSWVNGHHPIRELVPIDTIGGIPHGGSLMALHLSNSTGSALNSWKEIAAYMGRGVRTVQRYERELHLPVRRIQGKSRASVLALKGDLDTWLRSAPLGLNEASSDSDYGACISSLRKSMAEMANLRRNSCDLRVAHHESVLRLRSSLDAILRQMAIRKRTDA